MSGMYGNMAITINLQLDLPMPLLPLLFLLDQNRLNTAEEATRETA
jgi:hypothetical protein